MIVIIPPISPKMIERIISMVVEAKLFGPKLNKLGTLILKRNTPAIKTKKEFLSALLFFCLLSMGSIYLTHTRHAGADF